MKNLEKIFEKGFALFLKAKGISPISQKNYLSDLRHFLSWFVLVLKSKDVDVEKISIPSLASFITIDLISRYKNFLSLNNVPPKTANRRLSTLRKFCSFCISQGWIKENPAKKVTNIARKKDQGEEILKRFSLALKEEGTTKVTIKNYLSDIRQFLNWTKTTTSY